MPAIPAPFPAARSRASASVPVGTFRSFADTDGTVRWQWSDSMYAIHGFAPGEVHPTLELWLTHVAEEDRSAVRAALTGGELPSHVVYRLRHATGSERTTVLVLEAGEELACAHSRAGYLVDVTDAWQRSAALVANASIQSAAVRTGPVEQAVGVIVASQQIDGEQAMRMLTAWAERRAQDVTVAARALVQAVSRGESLSSVLGREAGSHRG